MSQIDPEERTRLERRLQVVEALQRSVTDPSVLAAIDGARDKGVAAKLLKTDPIGFTHLQAEAVLAQTNSFRTIESQVRLRDEAVDIARRPDNRLFDHE